MRSNEEYIATAHTVQELINILKDKVPADDNVELELIIDSRFTKDDVEKIMADYWSKFYRSVMIKAELLRSVNL